MSYVATHCNTLYTWHASFTARYVIQVNEACHVYERKLCDACRDRRECAKSLIRLSLIRLSLIRLSLIRLSLIRLSLIRMPVDLKVDHTSMISRRKRNWTVCCSVLPCFYRIMMTHSVLQCVAVCCSVLQCVAVCCSVLQCVAVCCSVLQCVAVCCMFLSQYDDVYTAVTDSCHAHACK